MKKLPQAVRLDFVAPVHRAPVAGALLCAAGVAAAAACGVAMQRKLAERARLEAMLGAAPRPEHAAPTPEAVKRAAEAASVEQELAVPWTRLLGDLEAAAHDTGGLVSVLRVEPDRARKAVRITAEVRAMADALAYLRRLQKAGALRYPVLESHERRKDDPDHPLRVTVFAEWRT